MRALFNSVKPLALHGTRRAVSVSVAPSRASAVSAAAVAAVHGVEHDSVRSSISKASVLKSEPSCKVKVAKKTKKSKKTERKSSQVMSAEVDTFEPLNFRKVQSVVRIRDPSMQSVSINRKGVVSVIQEILELSGQYMTHETCSGRVREFLGTLSGIQDQLAIVESQLKASADTKDSVRKLKEQYNSLMARYHKLGDDFESFLRLAAFTAIEADALWVFTEHCKLFTPCRELHLDLTIAWLHRFNSLETSLRLFKDVLEAKLFLPKLETANELFNHCCASHRYEEASELFVFMIQHYPIDIPNDSYISMLSLCLTQRNIDDVHLVFKLMNQRAMSVPLQYLMKLISVDHKDEIPRARAQMDFFCKVLDKLVETNSKVCYTSIVEKMIPSLIDQNHYTAVRKCFETFVSPTISDLSNRRLAELFTFLVTANDAKGSIELLVEAHQRNLLGRLLPCNGDSGSLVLEFSVFCKNSQVLFAILDQIEAHIMSQDAPEGPVLLSVFAQKWIVKELINIGDCELFEKYFRIVYRWASIHYLADFQTRLKQFVLPKLLELKQLPSQ